MTVRQDPPEKYGLLMMWVRVVRRAHMMHERANG